MVVADNIEVVFSEKKKEKVNYIVNLYVSHCYTYSLFSISNMSDLFVI